MSHHRDDYGSPDMRARLRPSVDERTTLQGGHMTAIQLDPRHVAETLNVDTFELAKVLRGWAKERLAPAFDSLNADFVDDDRLAAFDEAAAQSRRFLVAAVACEQAYHEDNPLPIEDARA